MDIASWHIETHRLRLTPWDRQTDVEDVFRIDSDPEIVRYLGGEARRVVGTIVLQHVHEGCAEPLEETGIRGHLARDAWRRGDAREGERSRRPRGR